MYVGDPFGADVGSVVGNAGQIISIVGLGVLLHRCLARRPRKETRKRCDFASEGVHPSWREATPPRSQCPLSSSAPDALVHQLQQQLQAMCAERDEARRQLAEATQLLHELQTECDARTTAWRRLHQTPPRSAHAKSADMPDGDRTHPRQHFTSSPPLMERTTPASRSPLEAHSRHNHIPRGVADDELERSPRARRAATTTSTFPQSTYEGDEHDIDPDEAAAAHALQRGGFGGGLRNGETVHDVRRRLEMTRKRVQDPADKMPRMRPPDAMTYYGDC